MIFTLRVRAYASVLLQLKMERSGMMMVVVRHSNFARNLPASFTTALRLVAKI